jgi:fructoselysine-6-P-deglycase FrlB-like protein
MSITYEEIKSQYGALAKTSVHLDTLLAQIKAVLSEKKKIIFLGSGSSFYIACSAASMAQVRLGCVSAAIPAGDLLLHTATYKDLIDGAAVVILSRSGETSEVVRAVSNLRAEGVPFVLLTITCVTGSTLSGLSDLAVELPWAFDQSVCQTRTVTCLYYACAWIIASLSGGRELLGALERTIAQGPAFMEKYETALSKIAGLGWSHAIVLGDAEIGGLCEEGALAFKEICQLPSNYHHVLDVRHGPMVLINEKTLVIAALSAADRLELDLVADLVKKGATVVACSDLPIDLPGAHAVSFGESLPHAARGIPVIAVCQLVAYYKSAETGANPDKPGGLSAWIKL